MTQGPVEWVQFVRFLDGLGDGWLAIVVYGVLAGILARMATSSARSVGLLSACALGIAGALLGVAVAKILGVALDGPAIRFLVAFVASMALALIGGWLFKRRAPGH